MALGLEETDGVDAAFIEAEGRIIFLLGGWVNIALERKFAGSLRVTSAQVDCLFAVHKHPDIIIAIEMERRRVAVIPEVCLDMRGEVEIIGLPVVIAIAARIIVQREVVAVLIDIDAVCFVLASEFKRAFHRAVDAREIAIPHLV